MTYGATSRPSSTAFFASSPAATITDGLEVFVQLVIAAMTTQPFSSVLAGFAATAVAARPLTGPPSSDNLDRASASGWGPFPNAAVKLSHTRGSGARSWGRLGPARLGSTFVRSSSSSSENFGMALPSTRKSPCSFV